MIIKNGFNFLLTLILVNSCSDQKQELKRTATFESFELTSSGTWTHDFTFFVDSSKIYFSPKNKDTLYYGILPDTVFTSIDSTYAGLKNDTAKENMGCNDCFEVALKIISKGDTTLQYKVLSNNDEFLHHVIKTLQTFIDNGKHKTIKSTTAFETQLSNFRQKSGM